MNIKDEISNFIYNNILFGNIEHTINEKCSLLENGILDSTGILEVVAFIEERFDISIEDTELIPENLDSIANIERFISSKTKPRF
ncbi:MAG TPA: acyl carrier protein [Candidatus Deferrimicrobiaceae bacterium]